MTPQDLDMLLFAMVGIGLALLAANIYATYLLLRWYHENLLMPALKMVASHQPSLKIVPPEKPPERVPMRLGSAETKTLDDDKLNDLYTKLHGTL